MKVKVVVTIVAVLAVMLVSSVVLAARFPTLGVGKGSSDIWVMNLHETEDANVVASYVDQDGNEDSSVGGTVDPLGNTSFPASSSGLANDWLGSMVLYSDRELASIAELYWRNQPRRDGWSGAAYSGYSEGRTEFLFPYVLKSASHKSIVTIQCVDTVDCDISMTYRGRDGNEVNGNPFTDTIEADSQESYDLWDPTLNPNIPDQGDTPDPWYGCMAVTSGQDIAGVAVVHFRRGHAAAYNAFVPGTDTETYMPFVLRRYIGGKWKRWTQIVAQNLNNYEITVYGTFYHRDGGAPLLTFSDTIPAYTSHWYNTRHGGHVPGGPSTFDALGNKFLGSAVISSTEPIVALSTVLREGVAGASQGLPYGSGTLVYPVVYRTKGGGRWTGYSAVVVQNLDPDDAITVHAQFLNSDGTVGVEFDADIPANSAHSYNTRLGAQTPGGAGTYDPLGTSWVGTAIVSTTSPAGIVGMVQNTMKGSDYAYMTNYNPVQQ